MASNPRSSGILFPLFSLPGVRDVGSLGRPARAFVDFLSRSGQRWFQTLPVNPIDEVGSPYAGRSAFAGETLYLDLEEFRDEGLLDDADLDAAWRLPKEPKPGDSSDPQTDKRSERIDYAHAFARRTPCWIKAFERYRRGEGGEKYRREEERFQSENADWLDDYVIFQTAAQEFGEYNWSKWAEPLRRREPNALREFTRQHADRLEFLRFLQLAFDVQWREFHEYCASQGVRLFGDVPIYVGHDSSDVWASPELFSIDQDGQTIREAGVPADSFNPDGQRWNSPVYNWPKHKETDFQWWKRRMRKTIERFDVVRLDHFIGFYNYYSFDGKEVLSQKAAAKAFRAVKRFCVGKTQDPHKTYKDERGLEYEIGWTPGPQEDFFNAIFDVCPKDSFIAEDLGVNTPYVEKLRDSYNIPGMKVLQFEFGGVKLDPKTGKAPNPVEQWPENYVAYTGTHDAAPVLGWLDVCKRGKKSEFRAAYSVIHEKKREDDAPALTPDLPEKKPCFLKKALGLDKPKKRVSTEYRRLTPDVAELRLAALRVVAQSNCKMAIFPIQDILGLSNDSRVNYPGVGVGNWTWRLADGLLDENVEKELRRLTEETGRLT